MMFFLYFLEVAAAIIVIMQNVQAIEVFHSDILKSNNKISCDGASCKFDDVI